ncbi:MAG TPA: hypothetical protein VIH90_02250 [Candidatus Saccharimonadales bacterium]
MEENGNDKSEGNFKYTQGLEATVVTDATESSQDSEVEETPKFTWVEVDTFSYSKKASWYLILAALTVAFAAALYVFTKDKITLGVVIASGLLVGIYAAKKPKQVDYEINRYGFKIGTHYYSFEEFKSFSLVVDGDAMTAMLVPLRRFLPYTYLNFSADIQDKILNNLVRTLPLETKRADILDRTIRRIGF